MELVEYEYETNGPPAAPVLLLVHGLLSSRDHWLPNLDRLSERFRLVRVDLPGHGATPMPANPAALHPDRLVDALERLRRRLGVKSWMICGQSLGAAITLRYALAFPEAVVAQIFTNANAVLRAHPDEAHLAEHARRVARLRDPSAAPFDRETIHPRLAKRFPDPIRARLVEGVAAMRPAEFAALIDAVMPQISLRYYLPRLGVPTCLINGRFERRFQPLRDWAAENIPGLEVVDLDGGHSVNIEAPEGFDAAVLAYLERHVSRINSHI